MFRVTFRTPAALAAACVALLAAASARADIIEVNFALTPQQEVPANNSNAAGAAQLLYDTVTQTYDLDLVVFGIELADLMGVGPNASPLHIHLASPGVNGPIVIDVGFVGTFFNDGLGIRMIVNDAPFGGVQGGINSNTAANEAAFFAGNLYLNVHTTSFPGGQIRGQIVPVPAPGALTLLGIAGLLSVRRRRRGCF